MKRFTHLNSRRRALRVLLVAALSLGAATALVAPAGAAPPTGPDPALAGASLSVSQHDGLVAGQVVNYTVTVPSGHGIFGLAAHLCHDPGPSPYTDSTFNFSGPQGVQCVNSGDLGSVLSPPATSYESYPAGDGAQLSLTSSWTVGTGTVTWNNDDSFAGSLTCNAANPCKLVVKANLNGTPSATYFSQQLTFAGPTAPPDPPAAPFALTPGDHQVTVDFAASPADGNSPIDFYTVTAGAPCAVACSVNTPNGSTTNATVTGLSNFQAYPFSVTAHNAALFTSAPAAAGSETPEPAAPTILSAVVDSSGGGGKMLLTWDYTGSTTNPNLIGFRITASGVGAPAPFETGSTNEFHLVSGLTNGEPYTFTVEATFAGGFHSDPSGSSSAATPTGAAIQQIIDVNRPQGALVLTQACATPNPYPVDGNGVPNPVYPTTCTVHLGNAQFVANSGVPSQPAAPVGWQGSSAAGYPSVGEGQFFKADGAINQVTIVDTRDSDVGWTVNGVLTSNFVSGANSFSAHQLGWQPAVTDKTPDYSTPGFGVYHNDAARGGDALPSNNALSLTGLGASRMLANATTGLGIAHLDALLHILIPVYANAGVYTATLQITAV